MQQILVERSITMSETGVVQPATRTDEHHPGQRVRRTGRSVTVNLAESPLSWLKARGLVNARQFEAGERLRGDYERASLGASVTMRWDASPLAKTRRGAADGFDATLSQIAAKQRFNDAVARVGPGLNDILWRVICSGDALPTAEKSLGWPARSGRVVLTLALDRLADAYGLR